MASDQCSAPPVATQQVVSDPGKALTDTTGAYNFATGAVLSQEQDNPECVIAFESCLMLKATRPLN